MSKLIKKDGKYYQKCKVVMLPTQNESQLYIHKDDTLNYYNVPQSKASHLGGQHLYILSDEEIKEEDSFLGLKMAEISENNEWIIVTPQNRNQYKGSGVFGIVRKIIATTNKHISKEVILKNERGSIEQLFPQPSQSFFEVFVREYNKGNVITEVLVEYNDTTDNEYPAYSSPIWLRVNPKDNTITIKKIKDSWNREEVIDLLNRLNTQIDMTSSGLALGCNSFNKWIEENL